MVKLLQKGIVVRLFKQHFGLESLGNETYFGVSYAERRMLSVSNNLILKGVITVDHDIEADDWDRIWWALATRFDPKRSAQIIEPEPLAEWASSPSCSRLAAASAARIRASSAGVVRRKVAARHGCAARRRARAASAARASPSAPSP